MGESEVATARRIAAELLQIGAVMLAPDDPFTWASGLKSPIYCDNRLTISFPSVRRMLTDGFDAVIAREGFRPDAVVGTATAGIPHAAWLSERLGLPMAYVRSKPKEHGTGSRVEGRLVPGAQVVVVEDLVSTGMSSLSVVEAVRGAGAEVLALLAIFSYGLPLAHDRFAEAGVPFFSLTSFEALLDAAAERGDLTPGALASLRAWQQDPAAWSAAHGG